MKIKKNGHIAEVILEDFSLSEYENFLKIKQLPSYEVRRNVIYINSEFLPLLDGRKADKVKNIDWNFPDQMFDYQQFITKLAFLKRKYALFVDTGLGKTFIFCHWTELVEKIISSNKKILIVSPLNVIEQTIEERIKFYQKSDFINLHSFGFDKWLDSEHKIGIVNYDKFRNSVDFKGKIGAIVLDESSILKSENGIIKTNIINASKGIDYKLCCTATPAPNDREEYANHALFLDQIRNYQEFFHRYFINKDSQWVLKLHATHSFYKYLASFSIFLRSPKKYGFEDNLKDLPKPIIKKISIQLTSEQSEKVKIMSKLPSFGLFVKLDGMVNRTKFSQISKGFLYSNDRKPERIKSNKPKTILELIEKHPKEQIIIWCNYDEEGEILSEIIGNKRSHFHLTGKMTKEEYRTKAIHDFKNGKFDILISKPRLLGFGLNFQNCSVMIYSGINDSYEQFYQSFRRAYRYGNKKQLTVYLPVTKIEEVILQNVMRKKDVFEYDANYQENLYKGNLIDELKEYANKEVAMSFNFKKRKREETKIDGSRLIKNDNILELEDLPENSIDLCIFSPPFASLFVYSSDIADSGNCGTDDEFMMNYIFFAKRLLKVIKPARRVCVHVSQLPLLKSMTGYSGMKDFRNLIIESMQKVGFYTKGEIAIKKNQQMQSIVKHAPGLAMHMIEKDAINCIPCYNDYILLFAKPGENEIPVTPLENKEMTKFDGPNSWVKFASGCWMINEETCDIRESDILKTKMAKSDEDVKHICPLQLEVYRRLIKMYSNPGEVVLDPFGGIGSCNVVATELNRNFISIELKDEYYKESIKNVKSETRKQKQKLSKRNV